MKNLWQFIKFGFVGISNTLISEGVYCILVYFRMPYLWAYFIGFILSVLNAYYWNSKYVFKTDPEQGGRVWWKVLLKTYAAYLGGFLVSSALLVFWIDFIQLSQYMGGWAELFAEHGLERLDAVFLGNVLAAGLNMLVTVPMNFFVNKYWAYQNN